MKATLMGRTVVIRSERLKEKEAGRLVTQLKNLGHGNVSAYPVQKGERYVVTAQPKEKSRAIASIQERNDARAVAQFANLRLDKTPSGAYFVENKASGGIYVVTETTCTCPHQTMRQARTGLLCKHIQYFKMLKALTP